MASTEAERGCPVTRATSPKVSSGPQFGQIGSNPVGGLPENPDPTGLNDIEKFRVLSLADDARPGGHAHLLSQLAEL